MSEPQTPRTSHQPTQNAALVRAIEALWLVIVRTFATRRELARLARDLEGIRAHVAWLDLRISDLEEVAK